MKEHGEFDGQILDAYSERRYMYWLNLDEARESVEKYGTSLPVWRIESLEIMNERKTRFTKKFVLQNTKTGEIRVQIRGINRRFIKGEIA